jgi:PAS domain S-box-containing protein
MNARPRDWTRAARVAGAYLALSLAWVLLSDWLLAAGGLDREHLHWLQTAKGVAFIALTAGLLYWLVRRELRAVARVIDLLRAVVDGTADGVFVKDRDGRYLLCNPAAAGFLRRAPADVLGRADADFLTAADGDRVRADDLRVMATGKADTFEETVTLDGSPRTFLVTKAPYRDAAGAVAGVLGVSRDVTDERRRERRYEQAAKLEAVGRLAGGIAHDFNNLLTVITGYADLLRRELPDGATGRELAAEITKAGDRAADLTRQLLAFGRQSVVAPRVLDPNALVLDIERLLRRLIGEDIDLAVRLQEGVGHVRADPGHLEQVLMNLAVNARDAMPTGGKLTLETRDVDLDDGYARRKGGVAPGRYVQLAVSDTGTGIPPEVLPHVFEPFFTTKGQGKGTGLGLATVHGIVQQSGGSVEVYTEAGLGTTFKVYLPRCDEVVQPAPVLSVRLPRAVGTETVLLVEDEGSVRAFAGLVLRGAGYTVLEAGDGAEAERVAAGHPGPIDLLVTDVVMPGMSGRELAGRLSAAHRGLKVLFMSGYTDDAVVRHGILEENVNFLQKPFTRVVLARTVRDALDAPVPGRG